MEEEEDEEEEEEEEPEPAQKGTFYCYNNKKKSNGLKSLGAKKIKGPINKGGGGGAKAAEGNPAECQQQ